MMKKKGLVLTKRIKCNLFVRNKEVTAPNKKIFVNFINNFKSKRQILRIKRIKKVKEDK